MSDSIYENIWSLWLKYILIFVMELYLLCLFVFFWNINLLGKYIFFRLFRNEVLKFLLISNFISIIDIYFWLVLISSTDNDEDRLRLFFNVVII